MDWMQFVSALVSSLAWPLAVLFVIHLLKGPIVDLIPKIRSLKYGQFHIDLAQEAKSITEELPPVAAEPEPQPEAPRAEISVPLQIAALSPRGAILSAWLEVESALNDVLMREGAETPSMALSPYQKLDRLVRAGTITPGTYRAIKRTLELRNEAVHMSDREISYEDAVNMVDLCERLVRTLQVS